VPTIIAILKHSEYDTFQLSWLISIHLILYDQLIL
jgi:hypothetical protein